MTCRVTRRGAPLTVRLLDDQPACRDGECRGAAVQAYRGLRARGVSDRAAFEASVTLYRLRHTASSQREAIYQVAEWISDDLERDTDGLTPQ